MQSTGNINYSFNKNNFYKIVTGGTLYFIPHYYVLIFISLIYIISIRFKQYVYPDRDPEYQEDKDIIHFFKSITYNSPFNILTLSDEFKNTSKFAGLSNKSYLFVVISYIITLIIILEGLLRNFLYSVYANIIQVNPNNNPYNNPNCINKIGDSPYAGTIANYTGVLSLSIIFLVPFLIPYLISFLKFDNYDIKHNKWFSYVVLFFIFFPIIMICLSKASFGKKLAIFPGLHKYVEPKDYQFFDFVSENFNIKFGNICFFIFIILAYCFYTLIYVDFRYDGNIKIFAYVGIVILLLAFIPLCLIFFGLSTLVTNKYKNDVGNNVIEDIQTNGLSSLYELLVKYNYPCFIK